jgi:hypothetical protein
MNNETIIKDAHQQEVVRIFRKLVASGVINKDAAIAKILRDFPQFFIMPTPDDIAKTSRDELNDSIRQRARAGLRTNKLADAIFRG